MGFNNKLFPNSPFGVTFVLQARHSTFNDAAAGVKVVCGVPMLPIKTAIRGPAGPWPGEPSAPDCIDEAIDLFRCNVLHRNFEVKGNADRLLIYLTLYIQSCLQTLEKVPNARDAERQLQALAWQSFKVPGEGDFPLNAFFPSPASAGEADSFKAYMKQVREELGHRLVQKAFPNPDAKASKFWLQFSKRKFMNKNL